MRPSGSPEELKVRRIKAASLLREGKSLSDVALLVGASPSSVHRWKWALDQSGLNGLNGKRHLGPKPKLSPSQRVDLKRVLTTEKLWRQYKHGTANLYYCARLIEKRYNVSYHLCHISRLVRGLGLSDEELHAVGFAKYRRRRSPQRDGDDASIP